MSKDLDSILRSPKAYDWARTAIQAMEANKVWPTALNPLVALELLAAGTWSGKGVLGPAALPARPFIDKLAELGSPHGVLELAP